MRILVLIGMLLVAAGLTPARAQGSGEAIQGVISRQIEAFRADDFEKAFSFASPNIRQMFGSPDRFGEMVQSGYPMVWRPADVRFSTLAEQNGRTVQSVIVTDQAGALFVLDYDMVPGDDGWQINGVTVRRAGDAGA